EIPFDRVSHRKSAEWPIHHYSGIAGIRRASHRSFHASCFVRRILRYGLPVTANEGASHCRIFSSSIHCPGGSDQNEQSWSESQRSDARVNRLLPVSGRYSRIHLFAYQIWERCFLPTSLCSTPNR